MCEQNFLFISVGNFINLYKRGRERNLKRNPSSNRWKHGKSSGISKTKHRKELADENTNFLNGPYSMDH